MMCQPRFFFLIFSFSMFIGFTSPLIPDTHADDLYAALRATLENNAKILSEQDVIRASGYDLQSAKMLRLPALSLQAETEDNDDSLVMLQVLQPLWVGGRIDNAIARSDIDLKIAGVRLLKVRRELMEDTAITYANLLGLKERLKAAGLNVKEHERLLALIIRRQEGSLASAADVDLARSRLSLALVLKNELASQLARGVNDLSALTLTHIDPTEPVPEPLIQGFSSGDIEGNILKASAALALRMLEVETAKTDARLSRSQMLPRIYARLQQDIYREDNTTNNDLDTSVALVFEGTLEGVGLSSWGRVKSADALIRAAQMRVDSEKNDVRLRIRSLVTDRDLSRQLFLVNRSLVKTTKETLESYMRQYEAGRKSWLDLLNIQREHAQARLSLAQVKSSFEQTSLRLAVLQGMLDELIGETD